MPKVKTKKLNKSTEEILLENPVIFSTKGEDIPWGMCLFNPKSPLYKIVFGVKSKKFKGKVTREYLDFLMLKNVDAASKKIYERLPQLIKEAHKAKSFSLAAHVVSYLRTVGLKRGSRAPGVEKGLSLPKLTLLTYTVIGEEGYKKYLPPELVSGTGEYSFGIYLKAADPKDEEQLKELAEKLNDLKKRFKDGKIGTIEYGHLVSTSFATLFAALFVKNITIKELHKRIAKDIGVVLQFKSVKDAETAITKLDLQKPPVDLDANLGSVKSGSTAEKKAIQELREAYLRGSLSGDAVSNQFMYIARSSFWSVVLPKRRRKSLVRFLYGQIVPNLAVRTGYLKKFTLIDIVKDIIEVQLPGRRYDVAVIYNMPHYLAKGNRSLVDLVEESLLMWWGLKTANRMDVDDSVKLELLKYQFTRNVKAPDERGFKI